jgi:hypothetical protein
MKLYVATSFLNAPMAEKVMEQLRAAGCVITYDWTPYAKAECLTLVPGDLEAIALAEVNGVSAAEALVFLAPGRLGAHTELGVALGLGIPVVLVGTAEQRGECVFHHHPLVLWMYGDPADVDVAGALLPLVRLHAHNIVPVVPVRG